LFVKRKNTFNFVWKKGAKMGENIWKQRKNNLVFLKEIYNFAARLENQF